MELQLDSWFISQRLALTPSTKFFIQLRYGSIGWALGASLGVGIFSKSKKITGKTVVLMGDGAFQACPQELSTLIRCNLNVTIILLNNSCYGIEDQLHAGPYNQLISWKYAELINAVKGESQSVHGIKAETKESFKRAMEESQSRYGVHLIECIMAKNDCTSELRVWGKLVEEYSFRKT